MWKSKGYTELTLTLTLTLTCCCALEIWLHLLPVAVLAGAGPAPGLGSTVELAMVDVREPALKAQEWESYPRQEN